MNGEMALQGPSRYPLAWWTHSCCLQREPTAARSGVRRALEEGTTKCAQTTEYQGHGPARGQESRVVSALCTTSKPYVLVRRVSDDKATSRVPPGTPRDEEIRGWSLQARLRAREGGLKSLEVLWVLGVDPAAGGCRTGPPNRWIWSADLPNEMGSKSTRRSVCSRFFLPLFRANGARCPGEVSSWVPPCIMGPLLHPSLQRGRKRTRGDGTRGAVRPGGLPRCPHRLGHPP